MAAEAQLGNAVVQIRATQDKLDKDLSSAHQKIMAVGAGIGKTLSGLAGAGLASFGTAAIGVMGAVAGVGIELGKLAKEAAPLEGITAAFNGIAESAGTTGDAMLAAMQKGSSGMIANRDLMASYNQAAQLVSVEFANALPDAMSYLSKVSAATEQDMSFMMDSLVKGVGRLSPMILDNLGIQVTLADATSKAAEMFGVEEEALSKAQIQAGMMEVTLAKLAENTAAMPDVTETASAKMARLEATFQNTKDALGAAFMPVLVALMDKLSEFADTVLPQIMPGVEAFTNGILGLFNMLSPLVPLLTQFAGGAAKAFELLASGDFAGGGEMIGEMASSLAEGLAEILPTIIQAGSELLIGLISGIASAIPAVMESMTMVIGSLIDTVVAILPQMMTTGLDIILAIVDGLIGAIPTLLTAGVEIISSLLIAVIEYLPKIAEGVLAVIPMLVKVVPQIIIGLVTAIIEAVPLLLTAGVEIIMGLIDGLVVAIPELLGQMPEIIMLLITSILEMVPMILTAGVEIILALVDGIVTMLPTLVTMAIDIILTIVNAITTGLPTMITAAIGIIMALINGLLEALPQLIAMVPEIIIAIVNGLLVMLPELIVAGVEILLALLAGIIGAIPDLLLGIVDVILAIVDMFTGEAPEFNGIGKEMLDGIWEGIQNAWGTFITNIQAKFAEIGQKIKDLFGISSPSKYFAEIGENLNKGLALGIKQTIELPQNELALGLGKLPDMVQSLEIGTQGMTPYGMVDLSGNNSGNEDIVAALDRLPLVMKLALREAVATLEIR